ncbi:MAG: hypothetical protein Kow00104_12880 [Rhodothalassiaceae bacterium]
MKQGPVLSGYDLMWLFVMFDLPTTTKKERKAAAAFRNRLLDQGFDMLQFSVYHRLFKSTRAADNVMDEVGRDIPEGGRVFGMMVTDRQYENARIYHGKSLPKGGKNPPQLALF